MPQRVIDGHKETLEGGAESARRILQGRRPAGHGRRLRLRLEPARRLRQGADVLRQATSASRRWRRSPAPPRPAPRSWAAATSSARSKPASWPTCWSSMSRWSCSAAAQRFVLLIRGQRPPPGRSFHQIPSDPSRPQERDRSPLEAVRSSSRVDRFARPRGCAERSFPGGDPRTADH